MGASISACLKKHREEPVDLQRVWRVIKSAHEESLRCQEEKEKKRSAKKSIKRIVRGV